MPIPGSGDDGNLTSQLERFDLGNEIADAEQHKPWPSGVRAKILYKMDEVLTLEKPDLVLVHGDTTTSSMVEYVPGT